VNKLLAFLLVGALTILGCSNSHQKAVWPEDAGSGKVSVANQKKKQKNAPSDKSILTKPKKGQKKAPTEKGAVAAKEKKQPVTNSIGMKFVWIPPGSFVMGSPDSEEGRSPSETPHKVKLTRGFYMGVYTVTQEQWQAIIGNNPSKFKGQKNLPVEQVSWNDCQEFIGRLRQKDKRSYRLPTEAEWEYACRAGTTTPFHFGKTISADQANYNGGFRYGKGKLGLDRRKTTPVGSFPPNAWGLYDMHGNVFQWCHDWYIPYRLKDEVDPQGGPGPFVRNSENGRVNRGGSFWCPPDMCRSAHRNWGNAKHRRSYLGFRICFFVE
jgi:formylglycine-generating enzyme required for sulfatase activity